VQTDFYDRFDQIVYELRETLDEDVQTDILFTAVASDELAENDVRKAKQYRDYQYYASLKN